MEQKEDMRIDAQKFELRIGKNSYHFFCDNDSPMHHVKEALFQFTKRVGQIEEALAAQQASLEQSKSSDIPTESKEGS